MKTFVPPIMALAIFLALGSCSSTQYVVDYDSSVNFNRYATYNFTPTADSIPTDQLTKKRLFDALSAKMNENDLRWNAKPDVYLHVHLMLKGDKKSAVTYGSGETYQLGTGYSTTYMDRSEFSEGTIFFELIDARRKNLVWTSRATAQIKGNAALPEKEIIKIVDKAFKKFPPKPPK